MYVLNYKLILLVAVILLISSCSETKKNIVDEADRIELKYFNNGDTLRHTTSSRSELENFKNVLKGKMEAVNCQATGTIDFYSKGKAIYSVNFSTDATGGDDECQYLMSGTNGWLLSYNTGMYIDESFYILKKDK